MTQQHAINAETFKRIYLHNLLRKAQKVAFT